MTSPEFTHGLLCSALSSSAAMLTVLLLRKPVRRWLGASAAYLLWLAVPASLLAMLLPAPRVEVTLMGAVGHAVQAGVAVADTPASLQWPLLLGAGWLAGAVLMAFVLLRQQRRFVRGLGRLQRRDDGCWQAQATAGLPALVGVWRPRIVLPAGFDQLYSAQEQRLVLLHERTHLRRGDIFVNALLAALQCVYWFNPLLPLALRRCREDQEFSCDERVIAHGDGARRSYGNAMLKTGLALSPLPVGCYWQNQHPLRERMAMLKRPLPGCKQWLAMVSLSIGLSCSLGYAAWAAQPGRAMDAAMTSKPERIVEVPPDYPEQAHGRNGKVTLAVDIDATGKVSKAVVESSEPQGVFDAAALDAVRQYRYAPTYRDGKAVPARAQETMYWDAFMREAAAPSGRSDAADYNWYSIDTRHSRISPEETCALVLPAAEPGVVLCGKAPPPAAG